MELYSVGKPMGEVFWLPADSEWFKIAGLKVRDTLHLSSIAKHRLMHKEAQPRTRSKYSLRLKILVLGLSRHGCI